MADPAKQQPDKDKFAPQNVAEDDKAKQKREFERSDLPRGSEPATRSSGSGRG